MINIQLSYADLLTAHGNHYSSVYFLVKMFTIVQVTSNKMWFFLISDNIAFFHSLVFIKDKNYKKSQLIKS